MAAGRRGFLGRLFPRVGGRAEEQPFAPWPGERDASLTLLSGARDPDGHFRAAGLSGDLHERLGLTTPLRLHAVVPAPGGGAVAVARRPGDLAFVIGPQLAEPLVLHAAEGRCFAGHGIFLEGGRLFAIAEIDTVTAAGTMAILDVAAGYARRAEFSTAGVGPHEMIRLGGRLVVANGAREPNTDPTLTALITTSARSNIGFLDPVTGAVSALLEAGADFDGVSLRHMAADGRGGVVVAAQESDLGVNDRPLLFTATERGLAPLQAPERVWLSLKGYVGSVAVDGSGRFALISSPRGGVLWAFDLAARRPVGSLRLADVCGIAADRGAGGFIATSGLGTIARLKAEPDGLGILAQRTVETSFDNHLFSFHT